MKPTEWGLESIEILTRGRRSKAKPLRPGITPEQKASLLRTAKRSPEVMVKVSGGGKTVKQVFNHLTYITRNGKLEGLTEEGEKISSREDVRDLLNDWGLEETKNYGRVKLAFNLVFSMPPSTPPDAVLKAVQNFARDEFTDNHQYLMVLHTDTSHPHVHLVVKAQGKDRKRLYIRKEMLETWREKFATKMREQGVDANATARVVRGNTLMSKRSALYHAERRRVSDVLKQNIDQLSSYVQQGREYTHPGLEALKAQRTAMTKVFRDAAVVLEKEGDKPLATELRRFANEFPEIRTNEQVIVDRLTTLLHSMNTKNSRDKEKGYAKTDGARSKSTENSVSEKLRRDRERDDR